MIMRRLLSVILLLASMPMACASDTLTGIDVLERSGFAELNGKRVALITNHTGLSRDGRSTIRLLHDAADVELLRIFSPEHGIEGKLDIPNIDDATEAGTGIPVFSLYGEVRGPTAEMLDGIDVVVFDIQDIGTRFYTYISTMGTSMEAAARHGVGFLVLDRPNPINGLDVAGPVLEDGLQSFVGYHTLTIRHGMTVGELALMFRDELELDLELEVVAVSGWQRSEYFDETGLTWINPSPNMRSLRAAILYPGIGLLETTNVSVGRGTATPFEIFGAPWIDGADLADKLNALDLQGVRFAAATFTPDASTFANQACGGVRITITDRDRIEPLVIGFSVARQLLLDYRDNWQTERYNRLLGNTAVLDALLAGADLRSIEALYNDGLETFRKRRSEFLLYD
jgi:uncharacterized protein YbbC (DUF1343 family)